MLYVLKVKVAHHMARVLIDTATRYYRLSLDILVELSKYFFSFVAEFLKVQRRVLFPFLTGEEDG